MSFTILYTPDGQPWQVPSSDVPRRLAEGLRREPPKAASAQPQPSDEPTEPAEPVVINPDAVRINHDPIAKIAKLPMVGTATAKAVMQHRPYTCIEDLIERVPFPKEGQSWAALEPQIRFD
jgi:hypothetical protein